MSALYEAIEATKDLDVIIAKLEQCRITLEEKLRTSKQLDSDILGLVDDTEVEERLNKQTLFSKEFTWH